MRCLVTGGTGFIGSNLAARLAGEGWTVFVTGSTNEQKPAGVFSPMVTGDLSDIYWPTFGKLDAIFHEAAITDTLITDEKEMMRVNFQESVRLFEYAKKSGCSKIVYASSTAVYGAGRPPYRETDPAVPLNAYGRSKKALDDFASKFASENPGTTIIGLRYCNVYGPGESHKGRMASMIYQLAQQMKKGNPKLFRMGEQERDYIYIDDVVEANMLALKAKKSAILNCGGGKAHSFNELLSILNTATRLDRKADYIENPHASAYQNHTECNMSLAKSEIGFVPKYSLQAGISRYYESGKLLA